LVFAGDSELFKLLELTT